MPDIDYQVQFSGRDIQITDWENEPTVAALKKDYLDSKLTHEKHVTRVNEWIKLRNAEKRFEAKEGKSKIVLNMVRKQAEWRYPSLIEPFMSAKDMFEVKPVTHLDVAAARQNKIVLNNQFNTQINKKAFVDEYVATCVDEGTVIVKVGWEFENKPTVMAEDVFGPVPVEDNNLARQMIANGQDPVRQGKIGTRDVEVDKIVKNRPSLEVCDYRHLVIDPTAKGDISKANFVIHRFKASLSDLKKDKRYHNLDKIHYDEVSEVEDYDYDQREGYYFNFTDKPRKRVWVYEYHGLYDIHNTGIVEPFICSWIGTTKVRMQENTLTDSKLPFVLVQFMPVRKENYGEPDAVLLKDNQNINSAVMRGMIDIMARSANGQQGVQKGALDSINFKRFEKGEDYQFNNSSDPRTAFHMATYPEIPNSALLMINYQNNEAESLTGVKTFNNGITGEAIGRSVTNGREALDSASKRELAILDRLKKGMTEIARMIISMNAELLSDEEVIRITDEEFVTIKRDDLAGNFDIELSITTAEENDRKAQELAFMLQTLGPNGDIGQTKIILAEIARLRKMPSLAKAIEEYQPEPNPLEVKKAELEIALLEAQVNNELAKAAENQVDVELKRAKTQTELSKARDIASGADNKDLDFVERSSGADHEKQKDLESQKQLGKLDEKAADAILQQGQDAANPETPEIDTSFLDEL